MGTKEMPCRSKYIQLSKKSICSFHAYYWNPFYIVLYCHAIQPFQPISQNNKEKQFLVMKYKVLKCCLLTKIMNEE